MSMQTNAAIPPDALPLYHCLHHGHQYDLDWKTFQIELKIFSILTTREIAYIRLVPNCISGNNIY